MDPRPTIYLPLLQSYVPEVTLQVRTATDPHTLMGGVLVGLLAGVSASFGLTRLIERLLFGVSATDPLTSALIPCCWRVSRCWRAGCRHGARRA